MKNLFREVYSRTYMKNIIEILFFACLVSSVTIYAACSDDFSLNMPQQPHVVSFTATPPEITPGDTSVLKWYVDEGNFGAVEILLKEYADTIRNIATDLELVDSFFVFPDTTTSYRLIASNGGGFSSAFLELIVQQQ